MKFDTKFEIKSHFKNTCKLRFDDRFLGINMQKYILLKEKKTRKSLN